MTEPKHHEQEAEHKKLEDHEGMNPAPAMPPLPHGHVSTAQHTTSIKTIDVTPGHSATLEPINETERYFIQDKKFESYLTSRIENKPHGTRTEKMYYVTIPATVHVGSFTVFKVQGMHGIPDHLEPIYHVEIQGNMHEVGTGTQYPEPQTPALEKLTQLEDKYLTGIQTQFKAFTQEVRELISTAHANGESLEAAKIQVTQTITTKEPLHLAVGESHIATSFTGGSAQSSSPAIVSAVLKFDGTKTAPKWKLVLTGNKVGEAIITYSIGSESHLQPIIVGEKTTPSAMSAHKTVKEEATTPQEYSVKTAHKKVPHALPLDTDREDETTTKKEKSALPIEEERSEESSAAIHHRQGSGMISEASTDMKEDRENEDSDEKTADKLASADAPFAHFLKESPENDTSSDDEEPSDEHTADEESAEDQEENK